MNINKRFHFVVESETIRAYREARVDFREFDRRLIVRSLIARRKRIELYFTLPPPSPLT